MSDIDRLMAVMEVGFDPHYREAWTRRQVEDSLALPTGYAILIDEHGSLPTGDTEAAGFVLARNIADEVELLLIAVRPEMRGRGIGRLLLERFIADAGQRGANKLFLEMRADNPAESLYRSVGFEPIGRRRDYYRTLTGTHIDALTFARPADKCFKSD